MGLLLAIDVGTTNLKAAAFTVDGTCVDIVKTPTTAHYDSKGHSVYKPSEIWGTVADLLRRLSSNLNDEILAISTTSMAEAVVPLDENGQEVFDIITWFDTRSSKEVDEIVAKIGEERLFEITGLDPNPIFSLSKILWVRNNHPDIFDRSVKWLQMTDYITYKLTGTIFTDYTLASRTMAFNVVENTWSDEILEAVSIDPAAFPTIVEAGTVVGEISSETAAITGLPVGTPVVMGGNDHPCAALSAGVLNGTRILDSSGTAEAFIYVSQEGMKPPMTFRGQRTGRFLDKERYMLLGGIISSGASFEWAYKTLTHVHQWGLSQDLPEYDEILEQVKAVPAGSNGVIFTPHLRGSGAPYWDPKMTGSFFGLKFTTTPQELLRAVLEGLGYQARMIVEMHEELIGKSAEAITVVGGSAKNIVWQQIKADIIQKPIEIYEETEATALGAALLAGVGVGIFRSISDASIEISKSNRRLSPNKSNAEVYQHLYQVYGDACSATEPISHRLHEIRKNQEQ